MKITLGGSASMKVTFRAYLPYLTLPSGWVGISHPALKP